MMQPEPVSLEPVTAWPAVELDEWLVAAGPAIDAVEIRRYPEGLWMLDFEDGLVAQVQPDRTRATLVLTAALGSAPPGSELEAYRLLLEMGAWWSVTGGLRMALDPGGDTVLQLDELPLAGLDADRLRDGLQAFLGRARAVRESLAQLAPPAGEPVADAAVSLAVHGLPGLDPQLRA